MCLSQCLSTYCTCCEQQGREFFFLFLNLYRKCVTFPKKINTMCLSLYPSLYLSIYLSISMSVCLSIHLYVCLSIYPSLCLSVYLSISMCVCLSIHLSICLSLYPSLYLSVSLSISLGQASTQLGSWQAEGAVLNQTKLQYTTLH